CQRSRRIPFHRSLFPQRTKAAAVLRGGTPSLQSAVARAPVVAPLRAPDRAAQLPRCSPDRSRGGRALELAERGPSRLAPQPPPAGGRARAVSVSGAGIGASGEPAPAVPRRRAGRPWTARPA